MPTGTIKRLIKDRGFGFIRPAGGGEELFFHRSAVRENGYDALTENQRVSYDEGSGTTKGPRAEDVRAI